jgi:hypothetical protein
MSHTIDFKNAGSVTITSDEGGIQLHAAFSKASAALLSPVLLPFIQGVLPEGVTCTPTEHNATGFSLHIQKPHEASANQYQALAGNLEHELFKAARYWGQEALDSPMTVSGGLRGVGVREMGFVSGGPEAPNQVKISGALAFPIMGDTQSPVAASTEYLNALVAYLEKLPFEGSYTFTPPDNAGNFSITYKAVSPNIAHKQLQMMAHLIADIVDHFSLHYAEQKHLRIGDKATKPLRADSWHNGQTHMGNAIGAEKLYDFLFTLNGSAEPAPDQLEELRQLRDLLNGPKMTNILGRSGT